MLIRVAAVSLLAGAVLAACGQPGRQQDRGQPSPSTRTVTAAPAKPPPQVHPAKTAPCPYLDAGAVASANGQHVGKVRISADRPVPACFFYRPDGSVQLTVRPYRGAAGAAHALVDAAAPVASSAKATDPPGWSGGEQPTENGAVYAVAKENAAVVVTTNQRQTIKARRIAGATIRALGW